MYLCIDTAASRYGERLADAVGTSDFTHAHRNWHSQTRKRRKLTLLCFLVDLHSLQQAHGERSPACPNRGQVDRMPFIPAAPLDVSHSGLIGWPMAPKHARLSSSGGPGVGGVNKKEDPCSSSSSLWILDAGMVAVYSPRIGKRTRVLNGMVARWFVTIGAVLMLMMQSSLAADGRTPMLSFSCHWEEPRILILIT